MKCIEFWPEISIASHFALFKYISIETINIFTIIVFRKYLRRIHLAHSNSNYNNTLCSLILLLNLEAISIAYHISSKKAMHFSVN